MKSRDNARAEFLKGGRAGSSGRLENIYRDDPLSKRGSKLRIRKRKLARYLVTSPARSLIPPIIALEVPEARKSEGFDLTSKRILRNEGTLTSLPVRQDNAVYTGSARGNTVHRRKFFCYI